MKIKQKKYNINMKVNIGKHAFEAVVAACLMLGGCAGGAGSERYRNSEFTHGNMKWHLEKNRTTQGEVIEAFGPPNVTSVDSEGQETWIYQKMSTSKVEGAFGGGLGLGVKANHGMIGGSGSFGGGQTTSVQSSRTCCMILKFDASGVLVEYRFRTSDF